MKKTMHTRSRPSLRFTLLVVFLLTSSCHGPHPSLHRFAESIPAQWPLNMDSGMVYGSHGMVASDAPLATHVGLTILQNGGNAIDAAVATAFALAVVMPVAGNIGGGGFLVSSMADGKTYALDFRETAPSQASRNMYLDSTGGLTDQSLTGHLASGIPGSVAGLWEAHRVLGTKPWRDLVEPAIHLAEDGFTIDKDFAESVRADSARLTRFPQSQKLFLPNGNPPPVGSLWKNPDLAKTLRRIAQEGPRDFYEGESADLLLKEMKRGRGIITLSDLKSYKAIWRSPIIVEYRGYQIISMPPPSSGGVALAMIANILEPYDLRALGWHSAEAIHVVAEAFRRTYADRNYYLGDPSFVDMPLDSLLTKSYAARRRMSIRSDSATPSHQVSPGLSSQRAGGTHTTHFSVADSHGNVVALTTTVNTGFGSAVTVTDAGFVLNNEMDDFAAKPGTHNVFGLVMGEANSIRPDKRMLSSMSPTIVLTPDEKPFLITGASGGPRIITATFQILSNMVDFGLNVGSAVAAPRFHHQHLPDTLYVEENGFPRTVLMELHKRGHSTKEIHHLAIGASIARGSQGWIGRSDPRVRGSAEGF